MERGERTDGPRGRVGRVHAKNTRSPGQKTNARDDKNRDSALIVKAQKSDWLGTYGVATNRREEDGSGGPKLEQTAPSGNQLWTPARWGLLAGFFRHNTRKGHRHNGAQFLKLFLLMNFGPFRLRMGTISILQRARLFLHFDLFSAIILFLPICFKYF